MPSGFRSRRIDQREFCSRCVLSRGAATEYSPGRKPGGHGLPWIPAPRGAKDSNELDENLSPLRGLEFPRFSIHGLAPVATFLRRSAAGNREYQGRSPCLV